MGLSRCYMLMKCSLILFSIIFLCVGAGACSFAVWALWDGRASEGAAARAGLAALAAWGGALAAGALAALAGALRGRAGPLAAGVALLALCAACEAAAACWGAAHLPQLRRALAERLERTVRQEYGVLPSRTQLLDAIQQGLECCGAESARDWQSSAWARAQAEEGGGEGALDLSVGAPAAYYWVPASCCATADATECALARRVPAASGAAAGGALHAAACSGRVLSALAASARVPLAAAGALLAAHALALLLALALCLRAQPDQRYKA